MRRPPERDGRAPRGLGRPILPREHGAWPVLYGSFLAGAGVSGGESLPTLLLLLGITAGALTIGPVTVLSRGARRRQAVGWLVIYAAAAVAVLLPLLLAFRFLLPFALVAAALLALRVVWLRGRWERSLPAELVAVIGLSMVGAVAHAVGVRGIDRTGLVLWLVLLLFFAGALLYVRMRIRTMRAARAARGNGARLWPCRLYHAGLLVAVPALAAAGWIPWATLAAFAPAVLRGLRAQPGPPSADVRRLGWTETAHAAVFVVLLVASFRLG